MIGQKKTIERFYSLDVLRGLAALSVVFWHWQHFFNTGTGPGVFDVTKFPFYKWIFVFYAKGWLAVDLFFGLSGFIFYWLYSKRVCEDRISAGRFALLRFSRLYPLHFVTLIVVAVSQLWLKDVSGICFICQHNDSYHFLLNLFFAQSWGFEHGYSFNGPAWSVSVEVLLYVFFYIFCRILPVRVIFLALISIGGFIFSHIFYEPVGRGVGSFFMGGCIFLVYQAIINSRRSHAIARAIVVVTVGVWILTILVLLQNVELNSMSMPRASTVGGFDLFTQWLIRKGFDKWSVLVLFPLTILALSLIETMRGSLAKRISFIGDISYSSYLLHFPLQIMFYVAVARYAPDRSIYYSPWFMLLFFFTLIITCFISFRYFEMPAQIYLRRKWTEF